MKYSWKKLSEIRHICVDSNTGKVLCEVIKDEKGLWYIPKKYSKVEPGRYASLENIKRAGEISLNREYTFEEIGKKLILLFVGIILYILVQ